MAEVVLGWSNTWVEIELITGGKLGAIGVDKLSLSIINLSSLIKVCVFNFVTSLVVFIWRIYEILIMMILKCTDHVIF